MHACRSAATTNAALWVTAAAALLRNHLHRALTPFTPSPTPVHPPQISFTEDVAKRFETMGWHVQHVADGNTDIDGLRKAVAAAKAVTDKPSLIKVSTLIGYGSPNKVRQSAWGAGCCAWGPCNGACGSVPASQLRRRRCCSSLLSQPRSPLTCFPPRVQADSHDVHGAPLGAAETAATRENLKWPYGEFEVRAGDGAGAAGYCSQERTACMGSVRRAAMAADGVRGGGQQQEGNAALAAGLCPVHAL